MFWFMGSVYFERVISDVICIRQLCDAVMDGRCSREMEKCVCGGGGDCREWISVSAVVLAARGSNSRATESLYSGVFLIVIYCFVKYVFY